MRPKLKTRMSLQTIPSDPTARWQLVQHLTQRMRSGDDLPLLEVEGEWRPGKLVLDTWERFVDRHRAAPERHPFGVYTHLPYCTTKCTYCQDFTEGLSSPEFLERHLSGVLTELELFAPVLRQLRPTSFYFGGGTPSLWSPKQMQRYYEKLFEICNFTSDAQLCAEANPNSFDREKAELLRSFGINRMSFGVQALDPVVLGQINRAYQKPGDIADAIALARSVGVESVNLDLVAGLPEQSTQSFLNDVKFCAEAGPDLLWLHPFNPEADIFVKAKRQLERDSLELREEMLHAADAMLLGMGWERLFRQPIYHKKLIGHPRHFVEADYLGGSVMGFGWGAFSRCDGDIAYGNLERPRWETPLKSGELPEYFSEILEPTDRSTRFLMFHAKEGIDRALYRDLFGRDVLEDHGQRLGELAELGWLRIEPNTITAQFDWWHDDLAVRRYLLSDRRLGVLADKYQRSGWYNAGAGIQGQGRTYDYFRWLSREGRTPQDLRAIPWQPRLGSAGASGNGLASALP